MYPPIFNQCPLPNFPNFLFLYFSRTLDLLFLFDFVPLTWFLSWFAPSTALHLYSHLFFGYSFNLLGSDSGSLDPFSVDCDFCFSYSDLLRNWGVITNLSFLINLGWFCYFVYNMFLVVDSWVDEKSNYLYLSFNFVKLYGIEVAPFVLQCFELGVFMRLEFFMGWWICIIWNSW